MMIGLAMGILIVVGNLVAFQYGTGAIRTAVEEAARVGARLGGTPADCEAHAERTLRGPSGLLAGAMGDEIVISCAVGGAQMVATATGEFEWWTGGFPSLSIDIEGRSIIETPVGR